MRHWLEDEHTIDMKSNDGEGYPQTPKPDLDAKLFGDPAEHDDLLDSIPDDMFEDPPARDLDPPPRNAQSTAAIICYGC